MRARKYGQDGIVTGEITGEEILRMPECQELSDALIVPTRVGWQLAWKGASAVGPIMAFSGTTRLRLDTALRVFSTEDSSGFLPGKNGPESDSN